jgi:hypothetical protein
VKNLKILIAGCGAALLVMLIVKGLNFSENAVDTIIMLAAFALPTVMGLMGIAKPPFQSWQAAMSAAGFGVAVVRTRIWETLPKFMDQDGEGKATIVLMILGLVVSLLAMAKPEDKL